jgi:hypothetical protein
MGFGDIVMQGSPHSNIEWFMKFGGRSAKHPFQIALERSSLRKQERKERRITLSLGETCRKCGQMKLDYFRTPSFGAWKDIKLRVDWIDSKRGRKEVQGISAQFMFGAFPAIHS